MQYDGDNYTEIMEWADGQNAGIGTIGLLGDNLAIRTLEGVMIAKKQDWIIRGVKGEFYPCKPDIFKETYEAI